MWILEKLWLKQESQRMTFNNSAEMRITNSSWNWVETDIDWDAWWRPKSITDFSLFHWLFTYNIPKQLWLTYEDGIEVSNSTKIISIDSHWSIKSWITLWNTSFLRSKRHPRYQPNRWHLFSTAWFLPNPSLNWIRKIGLINTITWVYFQLENWILYAVLLNNWVEKIKEEIDLSKIWLTVNDLQYWHLYDIQFQWRGVWDYFFYIDQKLVYKTSFLWKNTDLTLYNPALSAWFYCENTDWNEVEIKIGCCDITTEWGWREWAVYVSVSNSSTKLVNTENYPVICVNIKDLINWKPNTRDVLALRVVWSTDQRSYMKAYITRDWTAITWASYWDALEWSWIQFDTQATALDISKCQLLWNKRINADDSEIVDLPSDLIDFYLTHWDYLIITMEREVPTQTSNVIVSLEMWEEI